MSQFKKGDLVRFMTPNTEWFGLEGVIEHSYYEGHGTNATEMVEVRFTGSAWNNTFYAWRLEHLDGEE